MSETGMAELDRSAAAEASAEKINPRVSGKPMESRLEEAAAGLFLAGTIGAVILAGLAIARFANDAAGSGIGLLLCAAAALVLAQVLKTALRAFAEMVRLSKRRAGLEFVGEVSGQKIFECSACKSDVRAGEKICPACGAAF